MNKTCIECTHFSVDPAVEDEDTCPSLGCNRNIWEFESDAETTLSFRRKMEYANGCADFDLRQKKGVYNFSVKRNYHGVALDFLVRLHYTVASGSVLGGIVEYQNATQGGDPEFVHIPTYDTLTLAEYKDALTAIQALEKE